MGNCFLLWGTAVAKLEHSLLFSSAAAVVLTRRLPRRACLLPHMLALLSPVGAFKKGNVTINGDLRVIGGLSVNRIASSSLSVNGSITVSGALKTGFVKAQAAKFSVLETTSLSSPSGSLQVTGDLNMQTSGAASFLEVGSLHTERLIQHRRRQVSPCAAVSTPPPPPPPPTPPHTHPTHPTLLPHPHPPLPRPNSAPPTHAHAITHAHTNATPFCAVAVGARGRGRL